MSDPRSTDESEDVLSSIRRMVSEETDAEPTGPEAAPETEAAPAKPGDTDGKPAADRLVLTPELRIDQSTAGNRKAKAARSLEETVAELEAEIDGKAGRGSGRGGKDAARARIRSEAEAESRAEAPAAEDATAEDATASAEEGWEPAEGVPEAAFAAPGTQAEVEEAEVAEGEVLEPEADAGEDAPKRAEVAVSEPPVFSHSRPRSRPQPAAEPNVGTPDLDSLLDEDDLRALVAEVLREELKGPLGERITRNVRKLVRREIAQALSTFDLD